MFHVELFTSSIASGPNAFQQLTYFTPDNILPKLVNGVQVSPDLPYLMFVSGVGVSLCHLRAQATSMLPFPYISLSPNNRGAGSESPPRSWDYSQAPIPLKPTEELDIFASQDAGAAETEYALVGFCDGAIKPVGVAVNPAAIKDSPTTPGRLFTVHSATTTLQAAGQWSLINPQFDQPLYAGYYALVGARVLAPSALYFRLFPAMGAKWRPGGIAVQAHDQMDPAGQRYISPYVGASPSWGLWLTFYQNVPPQVEIFSHAADAQQEIWYDLVYLGPQTTQGI